MATTVTFDNAQPNYYGTWGGEWALWGGGSWQFTPKAQLNVQVAYDDFEDFSAIANIDYELVPGLHIQPEIGYLDNFSDNNATAGDNGRQRQRLERLPPHPAQLLIGRLPVKDQPGGQPPGFSFRRSVPAQVHSFLVLDQGFASILASSITWSTCSMRKSLSGTWSSSEGPGLTRHCQAARLSPKARRTSVMPPTGRPSYGKLSNGKNIISSPSTKGDYLVQPLPTMER